MIKLLPDSIANQIAAGEVIQRPASAVKELLENALDAGATEIKLIFKDGGKTLLQVIDNGNGMSPADARLSFERHATSKIRESKDLFVIKTMGFRGEALASIAAIAQVEMKTKRAEDDLGTHLIIEGSEVKKQEACSCPVGTSISIKNLFFNVPARRKFLKSDPVETKNIREEFIRIALANHEIFFSVFNDGHEIFHLKKGNVKQRIVGLMRKNYSERLVPVKENTNYLKINGFIGKPAFARKSRGEQFFFVNNRFIKSSSLHKSVMTAYDDLLQKEYLPFYVLFIEIDPNKIDVNVHPTKQEIKFEDDQIVSTFINAGVKRALSAYSVTPTIDFDQEVNLGFANKSTSGNSFHNSSSQKGNASKSNSWIGGGTGSNFKPKTEIRKDENWQEMFKTEEIDLSKPAASEGPVEENTNYTTVPSSLNSEPQDGEPSTKGLQAKTEYEPFQIHNHYILFHMKSGIVILDQKSAHERILFEKFLKCLEENTSNTQKLMFPTEVKLNKDDALLLNDILPEISALGYEIEVGKKDTFYIKGVPIDIANINNYESIFDELIAQFKENSAELKLDKRVNLARSMAKHSAIKSGRRLAVDEMKALIDQLFACDKPYIAPNGRKTFVTQSLNDLDRQFRKK